MSLPVYTLGAINLNGQTNGYYVEVAAVDMGTMQTTWDEQVSYAGGANVQTHVVRSALIPCTIPMWVQGTSIADLNSKLAALWVEVDKASNTLTTDTETFNIVYSSRPASLPRDNEYILNFRVYFTLILMRQP